MKWIVFLLLVSLFYLLSDPLSLGPIFGPASEPPSAIVREALSQPYRYLGKGKQAFAFCSQDGQWVIKFFNQKYFKVPFWTVLFKKERLKREKRKKYFLESYRIADRFLKKETGIAYLHLGLSPEALPSLRVSDRKGRTHQIDLNEMAFVLQYRAMPFYLSLQSLSSNELDGAIESFLSIIDSRIAHKIGDADHDVENNYGWLEGQVVQIDPGRLYLEEHLWDKEKLQYQWWSATHQFRKWLKKHYPDRLNSFDMQIETSLQQALQRSQASIRILAKKDFLV